MVAIAKHVRIQGEGPLITTNLVNGHGTIWPTQIVKFDKFDDTLTW